jgi:hypothetical protein
LDKRKFCDFLITLKLSVLNDGESYMLMTADEINRLSEEADCHILNRDYESLANIIPESVRPAPGSTSNPLTCMAI